MIDIVRFKNFKALRDVTVLLGQLTVLVGPNASGKTSVLQGLDYLFFLRHGDADFFRKERDFRVLRSRAAGDDSALVIHGEGKWRQGSGAIELSLSPLDESRAMWTMKATRGHQSFERDESDHDDEQHLEATLLEEMTPTVDVLRHRVVPTYEADAEGLTSDKLVARVLETVPVP